MADCGIKVDVVVPTTYWDKKKGNIKQVLWKQQTENGNEVTVHRPNFFSFGRKKILGFNTMKITTEFYTKAVEKELKKIDSIDVLYAHFLAPAGIAVTRLGKKNKIPAFCAFGESGLWAINYLSIKERENVFKSLTGIISVSSENKNVLLDNHIIDVPEKIRVIPNGCNTSLFFPHNKTECRKKIGIPESEFVGIFVGSFINRKGPQRVEKATAEVSGLKMIYVGLGPMKPTGNNILYCGPVQHDDLPIYLSSADFFVLPTIAEGCCNAIVEALACGLPIISSNCMFNLDILNEKNALLIDPYDINAIRDAIITLRDDIDLRRRLANEAEKSGKKLSLENRSKKIIEYVFGLGS